MVAETFVVGTFSMPSKWFYNMNLFFKVPAIDRNYSCKKLLVLKNISAGWFLSKLLPVPLFITLIPCLISYYTVYTCTINPARLTLCSKYPRWRKTLHIVLKYLSRSVLWTGVGAGDVTPPPTPPPFPSWSVDIAFKDDITVILILGFSSADRILQGQCHEVDIMFEGLIILISTLCVWFSKVFKKLFTTLSNC